MSSNTTRRIDTRRRRTGITLLELVIAGSMIAGMMTGLAFVMRSARQSWETMDDEYAVLHQGQAVVRHFVRATREASGVRNIAADGSSVTLDMPDGRFATWNWRRRRRGQRGVVAYRDSDNRRRTNLAYSIDQLRFTGYEADGVTTTATADEIQVIEVAATITLPRSAIPQRQIRSKVWIRSW